MLENARHARYVTNPTQQRGFRDLTFDAFPCYGAAEGCKNGSRTLPSGKLVDTAYSEINSNQVDSSIQEQYLLLSYN